MCEGYLRVSNILDYSARSLAREDLRAHHDAGAAGRLHNQVVGYDQLCIILYASLVKVNDEVVRWII